MTRVKKKNKKQPPVRFLRGQMCAVVEPCRCSSQFKNNYFTKSRSGSAAGSSLGSLTSCTAQLKAQGASRTCNESEEEEEEVTITDSPYEQTALHIPAHH